DLRGKRVGTLGATTAYQILIDARDSLHLVPVSYDDDVHPYADLVAGRVDAVLLDNIIAERSLRRTGGFVIEPEPVAVGHYVAVFPKAMAAERDSANAILRARMKDGSLERVFRQWNVWDSTQARYFQRELATSAAPSAVQSGGSATAITSASTYVPALLRAAGITLLLSCL